MSEYSARQIEIMDIAVDLISAKGIQKLTIKNLSAAVGVTEGAIYRHFTSKKQILLGLLERFQRSQIENFKAISALDLDPVERLHMIYTKRFQMFSDRPALAAVIFSEEIFQNDSELAEYVSKIMSDNQKAIKRIIKNGQKTELIRNDISDDQLAMVIMGLLRLIVTRWRVSGFKFNLIKEGEKLWETTVKILQN
jgi:TetR/AcrR family transcriptional regulator, fatty acid metabolism regulator protein